MKKLSSPGSSAIHNKLLETALIAASLVLPFGIQIGKLGLYGDDWSSVLTSDVTNNASLIEKQIQSMLINLAGAQPAIYHLGTLFLFFIIGLLLHGALIQVGMDRVSAIASAMLFILYPGFLQPVSGLQLISILIGLVFTFLSLHFYVKWQRISSRGIIFLVLGIICSTFSIVISPFSAGLTSFTILFLYLCREQCQKSKIVYSYILGIVLLFSGVVFVLRYSVENAILDPCLLILTSKIWLDSFIVCWRQVFAIPQSGRETLAYLLLMLFTAVILFWSFWTIDIFDKRFEDKHDPQKSLLDISILVCCALAGFGFILLMVVSGIKIEIRYPNDMALGSLGVIIAIVCVLGIKLIFLPKYRLAVLVMLIVLAAGAKYSLVNRFVGENSRVEDFLAQMAVRGDYFQPGAILISEQLPFDYTSQKSIDALIKNRFSRNKQTRDIAYISADHPGLREFLHNPTMKETVLRIDGEQVLINKNTLLGFWVLPGGCLHILDEKSEVSDLPQELQYVAPISKPELFKQNDLSDVKQLNQFRNKIENKWCFYYQQASRQTTEKKWQDVINTYKIAETQGFVPLSFSEYLPLLHASILEKSFLQSIQISREFISQPEHKDIICNYWKEYKTDSNLSEEVISEVEDAQIVLGCP